MTRGAFSSISMYFSGSIPLWGETVMYSTSIFAAGRQPTTATIVKRFCLVFVWTYPRIKTAATIANSANAHVRYLDFNAFRYPGCPFSIFICPTFFILKFIHPANLVCPSKNVGRQCIWHGFGRNLGTLHGSAVDGNPSLSDGI